MRCSHESVDHFTSEATKHFPSLKIVTRFDSPADYDKARTISNARIDLYPCVIAYCSDAKQVAFCLNYCRERKWPLRVRSGGHQHEGMSSGDDVFIVDMSEMNTIEYETGNRAWIPSGKPLQHVYTELEAKNCIIPGGACGSVFVGGLVQGGGWGLSSRRYGLTCDCLAGVEIVLANGNIILADATNEYADLFWAIRGGGGGNFGIVTRFLFELQPLSGYMIDFFVSWPKELMQEITQKWFDVSPQFIGDLTTFCRLKAVDEETPENLSVLIGGRFYTNNNVKEQSLDELLFQLEPFYDIAIPANKDFSFLLFPNAESDTKTAPVETGRRLDLSALYMPAVAEKNETQPAPASTCDGPNPHKVSAAFPNTVDSQRMASVITAFIGKTKELKVNLEEVNLYVSLMQMGGAIRKKKSDETAFYYREKEYIIQYQAWWSDKKDANTDIYIKWIEDFRQELSNAGLSEGSFINFPDKSLEHGSRKKLLRHYYGANLERLGHIKYRYDRDNLFDFEMGILPEKSHL